MKFAFETVIWGRQINDLRSVLKIISMCGYRGVEFAQNPDSIYVLQDDGPPKTVKQVGIVDFVRILEEFELELVGLAGGTLRERFEFCTDGIRPVFLYVEDLDDDDDLLLDILTADPPHILALHPHWLKTIERIRHARKAIDDRVVALKQLLTTEKYAHKLEIVRQRKLEIGDYVKLLPDTAHLTIAGEKMKTLIWVLSELAAVHIKDWTPSHGRYSHRYAQGFVPLGKGKVDFASVLDSLHWRSYTGWIIVEQDLVEDSPANSAWLAAEWLSDWLKVRNRPPLYLQSRAEVLDFERSAHILSNESVSEAHTEVSRHELNFLRRVMPATTQGPEKFYQAVTDALKSIGGLITVQIYSFSPKAHELYLLAASGIQGESPILQSETCLCGKVTRELRYQEFDLNHPDNERAFQDKRLWENLRDEHRRRGRIEGKPMPLVTVPIFNASNTQLLRYIVNFFPCQSGNLDLEELARIGVHLSRLADHVSDEACSVAAADTAIEGGQLTSSRPHLDRILDLICRTLKCRAATILLEDETGERLRVASTTGVEWRNDLPPHERHYLKGQGQTGEVWKMGEMLLLSGKTLHKERGGSPDAKSWEVGEGVTGNQCLYAPIGRFGADPVGVVRIMDRMHDPKRTGTAMFTHDDAAVLDAILQAALPQIEILTLQKRQLSAITRMTHEFKMPLIAINGTVDRIRQLLIKRGENPATMFKEDYFEDILNWSMVMGNQAQNARIFSASPFGGLEVNISQVRLRGDVIVPAAVHLRQLLRDRRFDPHNIEIGDFWDVPQLWVDKSQLQQVFFNLLANAIKYSDRGRFRIVVSGGRDGSSFFIKFSDYGIGIPHGLEDTIFEPGFRAPEAHLRDVSGQGIGLSVVRTVLNAHGGGIRLLHHSQPTTFEITLPDKLTHADWYGRDPNRSYPTISGL